MNTTAAVLGEIVDNTQRTTDVIFEIASSMREQSAASDDIRTAVEQLNQVTQQNASLVEEIAGSSESVSSEAEELSNLVGQFKLKDGHERSSQGRSSQGRFSGKTNDKPRTGKSKPNGAGKAGASGHDSEWEKHESSPRQVLKLKAEYNEDDFEKF